MEHYSESRFNSSWFLLFLVVWVCGVCSAGGELAERYWWLDEMRVVSQSLSKARTGRVGQWPRMSVAAGEAVLPLPEANGAIVADGKCDEQAWREAMSFPVGPLFADWREGPIMLQVSACRDEKTLYLAVESSCDLTGVGALTGGGLFNVGGVDYRIGETDNGRVVELAIPTKGREIALSFNPELIRRQGDKLPVELGWVGLGANTGSVWLEPIKVKLVGSDAAVRLAWRAADESVGLSYHLANASGEVDKGMVRVKSGGGSAGVLPCRWKVNFQNKAFHFDGFYYVEPVREVLASTREILERSAPNGGGGAERGDIRGEIEELAGMAGEVSPADRTKWRALYCAARALRAKAQLSMLDAPLLFVKRQPYYAGHIYDDYLTWRPGGGIYVIENPADGPGAGRMRTVIDPTAKETLGGGVYRDPDMSWDGRTVVFAHKDKQNGDTSIYEIGVDGRGLKRLTDPGSDCTNEPPERALGSGRHDITPAYLPDGRVVFTSTRPAGRVPCFNSEVDVMHVMNGDGSGVRTLSVNNVNEFDPSVLPDGRILYGRWEYVDKTALYMQSLWTMSPDGTNETALFANNAAKPTAVLDARAVDGQSLVVAALTPHNGQAVGAIAMIDPRVSKNELSAVTNFTPEYPTKMDQGLRDGPCDPWPLSKDDILFCNNAIGGHGIIEMVDRAGNRELVWADREISCFAPMPVKPRKRPAVITDNTEKSDKGYFLVRDIYRGLKGVKPGEVKWLRIVEETARTSGIPGGGRWWNQAFLVSWQGAYVVKNILGVVPVYEDGSAYFEAPAGRAIYFEALDGQGREIQRMRTFVQAAPGVTRSCVGCHENKMSTPRNSRRPMAQMHEPSRATPESWGSGYVDYATMIQPILDEHCVTCHGGQEDIAGGIDLSGGWTWAFNISYETLLKNNLVGFIRCHNSDVTSSDVLSPRTIGSGAAPLGDLLIEGHEGRIPNLTRPQRDVIMAWMDTNSSFYGTWNWTEYATCDTILATGSALSEAMRQAQCLDCHGGAVGNDWINLDRPERSRILRAPLKKGAGGNGLQWCRKRKAQSGLGLVTQRNLPPDVFRPPSWPKRDHAGAVHIAFESTEDMHYQRMLRIIKDARRQALSRARVDMPGAVIKPGVCRYIVPVGLPRQLPPLRAESDDDGIVRLAWERSADMIGLSFELYRGDEPHFEPHPALRVGTTTMFRYADPAASAGTQHYALLAAAKEGRSMPVYASITVPPPTVPEAPVALSAKGLPGEVRLSWEGTDDVSVRYNVYRAAEGTDEFEKLNGELLGTDGYVDAEMIAEKRYRYVVCAVNRRGMESARGEAVICAALPERKEPVFAVSFAADGLAEMTDGIKLRAKKHGNAKIVGNCLDVTDGGYVTYPHRNEFDINAKLTVELWVNFESVDEMPVLISCGQWNNKGWFLQKFGGSWRWHLGGVDCDGGSAVAGKWVHLAAAFDGRKAFLYQDGRQVRSVACHPNKTVWPGELFVGQYSGGVGPQYQVKGKIAGVKIYRRAMGAKEVEANFRKGR